MRTDKNGYLRFSVVLRKANGGLYSEEVALRPAVTGEETLSSCSSVLFGETVPPDDPHVPEEEYMRGVQRLFEGYGVEVVSIKPL